jgi:hypothetical protein
MRKAEGFITGDGTFFESKSEAELHEAEVKLRHRLSVEFPQVSQEKFLEVMTVLIDEMGEYINAYQVANKRDPAESEVGGEIDDGIQATANDSLGHVSSTEEDLAVLLKLPARGLEHVPDVGSSARTKKVPNGRKKHGPGVRERDA